MASKLKILILEDNPADAELVERELQGAGISFTSKRVETRETFISELKTYVPDVILSFRFLAATVQRI